MTVSLHPGRIGCLTTRRNPPTLSGIGSAPARPPSERKPTMIACIRAIERAGLTRHDLPPADSDPIEAMEGGSRILRLADGPHSRIEERAPLAGVCGRSKATGHPSGKPVHGFGDGHAYSGTDQSGSRCDARRGSHHRPERRAIGRLSRHQAEVLNVIRGALRAAVDAASDRDGLDVTATALVAIGEIVRAEVAHV